jgi:hypothetical protein
LLIAVEGVICSVLLRHMNNLLWKTSQ